MNEAHAKEVDEENEENEQTMPSFDSSATCISTNRLARNCVAFGRVGVREDDDSFFGNIDLATKVKQSDVVFHPDVKPGRICQTKTRKCERCRFEQRFFHLSSLRNRNRRRCRIM